MYRHSSKTMLQDSKLSGNFIISTSCKPMYMRYSIAEFWFGDNIEARPWDWNVKYLEKSEKNVVLSEQRNILYFFIVFFLFSSLSSSLSHRRISFLFFFLALLYFLSFSLSYSLSAILSVSLSYSLCCGDIQK